MHYVLDVLIHQFNDMEYSDDIADSPKLLIHSSFPVNSQSWQCCQFCIAYIKNSIYLPSMWMFFTFTWVFTVSVNRPPPLPSPVLFHVFTVSVSGPSPSPALFHLFTVSVNRPLPSPVLSILLAVFTLSPNKQYLGILIPTTPATHGPT